MDNLGGCCDRAISWAEFWKLPQARLSFLIRATYNTLPSPKNLHQWLGTEDRCRIHFLRQGEPMTHISNRPPAKLLTSGVVWKMEVDLGRQLQFPHADLVAECRESGWSVRLYPVEVGARGFVGRSTSCLLKDLGLRRATLSRSTKELSEEAEKARHWLWLKRRYKAWGVTSN